MQIHLKQSEIETALCDYVTKLGISLRGRDVSIVFTSGRQGRGLTADLDIPDINDLPDFPEDEPTPEAAAKQPPHLKTVVGPISNEASAVPVPDEPSAGDIAQALDDKPATTSLFGS